MIVNVEDAAQRLEELYGRAEAGEEVVIFINDNLSIRLEPIEPKPQL